MLPSVFTGSEAKSLLVVVSCVKDQHEKGKKHISQNVELIHLKKKLVTHVLC